MENLWTQYQFLYSFLLALSFDCTSGIFGVINMPFSWSWFSLFILQPSIEYNGTNIKNDKRKEKHLEPLPITPNDLETSPGMRRRQKKFGLSDFNFIKVLGKGSFGKVNDCLVYSWADLLQVDLSKVLKSEQRELQWWKVSEASINEVVQRLSESRGRLVLPEWNWIIV